MLELAIELSPTLIGEVSAKKIVRNTREGFAEAVQQSIVALGELIRQYLDRRDAWRNQNFSVGFVTSRKRKEHLMVLRAYIIHDDKKEKFEAHVCTCGDWRANGATAVEHYCSDCCAARCGSMTTDEHLNEEGYA